MKQRPLFSIAALACAASGAFAQQKANDPQAIKPSYQPQPASNAIDPVAQGPLQLISVNPPGTTVSATSNFTNSTPIAIPDVATISQNLVVSGVGTFLWDVDLTTFITHTYCADLDVTLTAPGGKIVSITTDNGGLNDDVFNGTLWDDSAPDSCQKYPYTNATTATPLNVEGAFTSLRGINPNGTWTLTITDDLGADVGNMTSWSLAIRTLTGAIPAPSAPTVYSRTPNLAITDFTTVSDAVTASGLGTNIAEVRVMMKITHTYAADVDAYLQSPAGTIVGLVNLDGLGNDNVFNGTTFYDDARTATNDLAAGNYAYVNGVVATDLAPDGEFSRFWGENPNGVWTMSVYDNAAADSGNWAGWDLSIRTYTGGPPPPPVSYCTAGTTTNGCVAHVSATNNPSITGAPACIITVSNVEGQKNGIIFYGLAANSVPWATGSNSTLCVKAPTQRTGTQASGGTVNLCDGTMTLNWEAYMAANVALGEPWAIGNKAYIQGWFRDPPAVKTTNLSDGLEVTYQP